MAKKLYEESSIQDIASAIRAKNGSSDTYTVAQMSTAIADIPTGGGSGSGGSMTTLYTASNETAPSTITLDDSVTNYDMIIVNVMPPTSGISTLATVSNTYIVNCLVANCVLGAQAGSYHAWYYYTNATTLTQYVTEGGYYIKSVVGVKLDGGEYYNNSGTFNINGINNNVGLEAYINE